MPNSLDYLINKQPPQAHSDLAQLFQDLHHSLPYETEAIPARMSTGTQGVEVGGSHKVITASDKHDTDMSNVLDLHDLVTSAHGPTLLTALSVVALVLTLCGCGCTCVLAMYKLFKKSVGSYYNKEKEAAQKMIHNLPLFHRAIPSPPPRVHSGPVTGGPSPPAYFTAGKYSPGNDAYGTAALSASNVRTGERSYELYPHLSARTIHHNPVPWPQAQRGPGAGPVAPPRSRSPSPRRHVRNHRRSRSGSR